MGLDIRGPIGLLFLLFGVLITLYGGFASPRPVTGLNIDLLWGGVLELFGVFMLWLARRQRRND